MEQEFFLSKGRLGSDKQNALDAIWLGLGRVNAFGHKGGGAGQGRARLLDVMSRTMM